MSQNLYAQAARIAEAAVRADKEGRYEDAIQDYLRAAEILVKAAKVTRNPMIRETYEDRAKSYVGRAKVLKETLKKAPASRGGRDEDDEEIDDHLADAVISEKPDVKLEDVAGLQPAKQALREAIVLPLMRPDLFKGARRPWRGILLFGPPGTGKTMLAKATAGELDATFFNISPAVMMSKWLGESEKIVKRLFDIAKEKQPSIVFIDEVDALTQARSGNENDAMRRVKTQLLTSMEGLTSKLEDRVVVIGATNVPWEIDPAFRRRFERRIYIPLPDRDARIEVFKIHVRGVDLSEDVDFELLADLTENFSAADIANICREAIMRPVRELDTSGALENPEITARPVNMDDFLASLKVVKPSVSPEELERFEEWAREFGTG